MKKSLFTFGLLASTLVMLSVMPLLNYNNSAMAQGYNIIRDNSSYSQYPTEDKKYECRTGSFEGFFVSSVEFCKKIPVIDNRGGNNGNGSGNGTVGPQGEPGPAGAQGEPGPAGQAGQQGIPGVSGPSGPRGLSGPAGPEGIQGPIGLTGLTGANSTVPGPQDERGFNGTQGPSGISKINASNYYSITGNRSTILLPSQGGDGVTAISTISCNPGDVALSGEYSIISGTGQSPLPL